MSDQNYDYHKDIPRITLESLESGWIGHQFVDESGVPLKTNEFLKAIQELNKNIVALIDSLP